MSAPEGFHLETVEYCVRASHEEHRVLQHEWMVPNRYEIGDVIGSGAFGVVVKALDRETGEYVAIKRVENAFRHPLESKRLLREVKILRHLKHPNIIQLRDLCEQPSYEDFNHLYFVFELAHGDLQKKLRSPDPISEDERRKCVYDLLKALKYTHSAHVLHRDIKPGNILITEDGTVKLCDYGLARSVHEHSSSGPSQEMTLYVVTRWFRAPELLLQFKEYTSSIDIWSVACILAETYLRTPLFPGNSYLNQITSIFSLIGTPSQDEIDIIGSPEARQWLSTQPVRQRQPLSSKIPQASEEALDLLDRMLVFHPDKRITVDEALEHPYFASIRNPDLETEAEDALDFDFENLALSVETIKTRMWDELREFHPHMQEHEEVVEGESSGSTVKL